MPRPSLLSLHSSFGAACVAAVLGAAVLFAPLVCLAQAAATSASVRGIVTALAGDTLEVMTRSGQPMEVKLTPDTAVRAVLRSSVDAIRPGSYIGTAAQLQADGTLRALEVHIFAPSLHGSGEGHRNWDLAPGSTMTNGTVASVSHVGRVEASQGRTITVRYRDGEQHIVIPDGVPIVGVEPGDRSLLVRGAHVVLFANRGADGGLTARTISVGKHGVTPPM